MYLLENVQNFNQNVSAFTIEIFPKNFNNSNLNVLDYKQFVKDFVQTAGDFNKNGRF